MTRILIVEADSLLRETLGSLLEYEGYVVRTASDACLALALAVLDRPDVIVADIDEMTAADLLEIHGGRVGSILFIGMTSVHGHDDGARVSLKKPFSLDDLLDVIEPCRSAEKTRAQR